MLRKNRGIAGKMRDCCGKNAHFLNISRSDPVESPQVNQENPETTFP